MVEIITNAFLGIGAILSVSNNVNFSIFFDNPTFIYRNRTIISREVEHSGYSQYIINLSEITMGLIFPIICLFLIVLRRAFINLPYKQWVTKYTVYILIRVIISLISILFNITLIIGAFVEFLLGLSDIFVYISSSRAFYVLLKGRRDEALYHSSRREYLEKKRIANQFFYAQVSTHFLGLLLLLIYISVFANGIFYLFSDSNFFELLSFGYFPKFPSSWHAFAFKIGTICGRMKIVFIYLMELYILFAYFFVSLSILVKLFNRRKKFNHVNDWLTRPLMERYRSSLEERRTQQRPPFIQAFRSFVH